MDMQLLIGTIQSIAIAHRAWRGDIGLFADVTLRALGGEYSQRDLDELRSLLRSNALKSALNSRDVLMWTGHDGLLRLIDAQPVSLKAARAKVAHQPGPYSCRFCLMNESPKLPELEQEKSERGEYIAGSFTHPACANSFRRLRLMVAAAEVNRNE